MKPAASCSVSDSELLKGWMALNHIRVCIQFSAGEEGEHKV